MRPPGRAARGSRASVASVSPPDFSAFQPAAASLSRRKTRKRVSFSERRRAPPAEAVLSRPRSHRFPFDDTDAANTLRRHREHAPRTRTDHDLAPPNERAQPYQLLRAVWTLVPSFAGNQQQDAHEFTRFLLERLRSEFVRGDALADQAYLRSPIGRSKVDFHSGGR